MSDFATFITWNYISYVESHGIRMVSLINSLLFIAQNVLAHFFNGLFQYYSNIKLGSPMPVFDVG